MIKNTICGPAYSFDSIYNNYINFNLFIHLNGDRVFHYRNFFFNNRKRMYCKHFLFYSSVIPKRIFIPLILTISVYFSGYFTHINVERSGSAYESWANCSKLNPTDELSTCLPSIIVAGYEKCGTSALYNILQRHSTSFRIYCVS